MRLFIKNNQKTYNCAHMWSWLFNGNRVRKVYTLAMLKVLLIEQKMVIIWQLFCILPILSLSYPSKTYCRKKGILFVAIDQKRPLSDQGPFDIVLHKVSQSGIFW